MQWAPAANEIAHAGRLDRRSSRSPQPFLTPCRSRLPRPIRRNWIPVAILGCMGVRIRGHRDGPLSRLAAHSRGRARQRPARLRCRSQFVRAGGDSLLTGPAGTRRGGTVRSVLLVPEGIADRLTPRQLEAVLAHELCHVRRRDNLTSAIHMIVEAMFWFHPLVWWIGARLVEERERACDEDVLRLGGEACPSGKAALRPRE